MKIKCLWSTRGENIYIHYFAAAPFPLIVNEKKPKNIIPVGAMVISTRVRFSFCNTSLFNIIMDVLRYWEKMLVREKVRNKQMDNQVIKTVWWSVEDEFGNLTAWGGKNCWNLVDTSVSLARQQKGEQAVTGVGIVQEYPGLCADPTTPSP